MKALYFKVPRKEGHSIRVENWDLPHFFDPIHFHEDSQITIILEGHGTFIVGHRIAEYAAGDVLLFGPNLQHVLRASIRPKTTPASHPARAISFFFNEQTCLEGFAPVPELSLLTELVITMRQGIKIHCPQALALCRALDSEINQNDLDRFHLFIQLLKHLAQQTKRETYGHPADSAQTHQTRRGLNKTFEYILENFHRPIALNEVAAINNMTPTAFCRFFKRHTQKTFSRWLVEIRIDQICRMITQDTCSVTDAYLACGYNNSSNFYRHFKKVLGMSPGAYLNRFHEGRLSDELPPNAPPAPADAPPALFTDKINPSQ